MEKLELSAKEKQNIRKLFDEYLLQIVKYPEILNLLKSEYQLRRFSREAKIHFKDKLKTSFSYDELKTYFEFVNKILRNVDIEIEKIEDAKKSLVVHYNYNADSIIKHSRNIEKLFNRITYLSIILTNYQKHKHLREKLLEKEILNHNKETLNEMFQVVTYFISQLTAAEYERELEPYLETLEEKILAELEQLNILKELPENDDVNKILHEINLKNSKVELPENPGKQNSLLEKEFLTTKEVKKLLNIKSDTTLNTMYREGKLIPKKAGNKNLYSSADIKKLLE